LSFIGKIAEEILNEIRATLRGYVRETEDALKKHTRKLLVTVIILGVLAAVVTVLLGSAAVFILIGSVEYLEASMPAWEAWDVVGLTSAVVGGLLLLVVMVIIRKELRPR
jgi:hypothetical protein